MVIDTTFSFDYTLWVNMKRIPWVHLLFLILSFVLTYIWFQKGLLIALGESAIPFYDLSKVFIFYGHSWSPIALGFFPGTTPTIYAFFSLGLPFQFLNVPGFLIQAIVTFILIFSMLEFSFFASSIIIEKNFKHEFIFRLVSSLFYTFNLICLVSVWNRVQYPFILFYILLPLILWLFAKTIRDRNLSLIIVLNFALIPFAAAFSAIPFFILTWVLIGLYVVFIIFVYFKKKDVVVFSILALFLTLFVWILFNAWWFFQFLVWALTKAQGGFTLKGNIDTLNILSDVQGNLSYVFRLSNKGFFDQIESVWGSVYFSTPFTVISFIVPFLAFMPLLIKKKPTFIYFFLLLALVVIFFTKGSAGPFGQIFIILFSYIHPLESFRSAFEKFGLALPLAYAPLIGFSVVVIYQHFRQKFGAIYSNVSLGALIVLLFGILVFPYWNGWIFTYPVPHANDLSNGDYVEIPSYYKDADNYFNLSDEDFRVYAMPVEGDGLTTTWEHSFTGIDYSNGIFRKSFLSLTSPEENLQFIMNQLQYAFDKAPEHFTTILGLVNAKYVMVRTDVDYIYRSMRDPKMILSHIEKTEIPDFVFSEKFGELHIFENTKTSKKIYPVSSIYTAVKDINLSHLLSITSFSSESAVLNTGRNSDQDKFLLENSSADITKPTFVIDYTNYPTNDLATAEKQIPQFLRFLPGSKFYPLLQFKENLEDYFAPDPADKFFRYINLSGKRLAELQILVLSNDTQNTNKAARSYIDNLEKILPYLDNPAMIDILTKNIDYFRYRMISENIILTNLEETSNNPEIKSTLKKTQNNFNEIISKLDVVPLYKTALSTESGRMVYRFNVKEEGNYNLVIEDDNLNDSYEKKSEWRLQVDDKFLTIIPVNENGFLNFGEIKLSKGIHEIQLELPIPINLAPPSYVSRSFGKTKEKTIFSFPLLPFDRYSDYKMKFEYKSDQLDGARVEINTDIDYYVKGKSSTIHHVGLGASPNDGRWKDQLFTYNPGAGGSRASISFIVDPEGICEQTNRQNPVNFNRCLNDSLYRDKFTKPVTFSYRNLFLERMFTNSVLLVKNNKKEKKSTPKITYEKISPSEYVVKVADATSPFFLVFSESFHPRWQAYYSDKTKVPTMSHFLANSYANAWYIDKKGDYELRLFFEPERFFKLGIIVSVISFIVGIVLIFILRRRRR